MIEFLAHTADIRVRVTAPTIEDLFREAMRSLSEAMEARPADGDRIQHKVAFGSYDRTALLVDFLNEILGYVLVERVLFDSIEFISLTETSIDATVGGKPAILGDEVKAVTYHEADVQQGADGTWSTVLVFDI